MEKSYRNLCSVLGIEELPRDILQQALCHSSAAREKNLQANSSNERLEFLGDAVLELTVSHLLYQRFPDVSEGRLTGWRAQLVCRENLAQVARRLGLGELIIFSRGEKQAGGGNKPAILADALEALLGAVYLCQGYETARDVVQKLLFLEEDLISLQEVAHHQWKTLLQERVQQSGPRHIVYQVTQSGADHEPWFTAYLEVDGELCGTGSGRSKQEAEQAAARAALVERFSSK